MIRRALIHVAGPPESGKTTLIERLLDKQLAFAACIRGERVERLRRERESAPKKHSELRRYREAGASAVAFYRFPSPDTEAFYDSEVMGNYSEAVFIEGRGLAKAREAPPPNPTEHWALGDRYDGLERAQLVVVNVRPEDDWGRAEELCGEIPRLRKDPAVFDDVSGRSGNRVPITAVVASLTDPKDTGLSKCFSRVRRTLRSVSR